MVARRGRTLRHLAFYGGILSAVIGIFAFTTGNSTLRETWRAGALTWRRITADHQPLQLPLAKVKTVNDTRARIDIAVADYNQSLAAIATRRGSIELTFEKVRDLEQLLVWDRAEDRKSMLERMSEVELAQFGTRLPGVRVWCDDSEGVEADAAYFHDLAVRFGTPADIDFFVLYRATYPASSKWPDFIHVMTDVSGCTQYGDGKLTGDYARWNNYATQYPASYTPAVQRTLREISSAFTDPTCACGDVTTVAEEFSRWLTRFPNDALTPAVQRRLQDMAAGKSDMRFNCGPH